MNKNHLLFLFAFLFFTSTIFTQIPNAGFESWTGSEPDGWVTSNVPSFITNVTQSAESHSGSSAVKLVIGSFISLPYWGHLFTGIDDVSNAGFPVSQRHGSLRGYYKLIASPGKVLEITVFMQKAGSSIGGGVVILDGDIPNYAEFIAPIDYISSEIPDTAVINITYLDTAEQWTVGGGAFVDDLSFGGFVGIEELVSNSVPVSYELFHNYPNPFNPSTKIEYSIPEESFVELKIFNLIGEEAANLVSRYQKAGTYRADFNAEGLQSGIYIARLTANNFTRSIKMIMLK